MKQIHSHIDQILEVFRILQPQEAIDAKTMAELTALTPKQASSALSRLHQTGYLARVGSDSRYALYIPTTKPMRKKGSSIQKEYKSQLGKRSQRNHIDNQGQIAKRILRAFANVIERELGHQDRSQTYADIARQLTLFSR